MTTIVRVRARAYQVGFGDCLLLTFGYDRPIDGRSERHMLIDCGTTRAPWRGFGLSGVATAIADHTGGQLDVLVATHRHKDHIGAFGDTRAAGTFERLRPRWLIRPWTDDPDAPADAEVPHRPLDDRSREFAQLLAGTRTFAAAVEEAFGRSTTGLKRTLLDLAATQIPNERAIATLDALAGAAERVDYTAAGDRLRRARILPQVTITVLGPPTLKQVPGLTRQRSNDAEEFWFRRAADLANDHAGRRTFGRNVYHQLAEPDGLGTARWLIDRLDTQTVAGLLRIVRAFDQAINNTSVVMLVEAGTWKLLISGDAQIENWSHTLRRIEQARNASLRDRIANVDLYKVGHHGSRNGTPKSLHRLWREERTAGPLTAILSTKSGVHGHTAETAVPRSTLVDALAKVGTVLTTETVGRDEPWLDWNSVPA